MKTLVKEAITAGEQLLASLPAYDPSSAGYLRAARLRMALDKLKNLDGRIMLDTDLIRRAAEGCDWYYATDTSGRLVVVFRKRGVNTIYMLDAAQFQLGANNGSDSTGVSARAGKV